MHVPFISFLFQIQKSKTVHTRSRVAPHVVQMEVFVIPGRTGRPYPRDRPLINFRDARVRRMFARAAFAGKQQTVIPIRGIDEEGNVDLYQPGDEVAYFASAGLDTAARKAAHIAVFHRLGWSDIDSPVYSVAMVYHSFLLAFDFDTASVYESLSKEPDERVNTRLEHYLRGNYWYCRVRLCDFDARTNKWVTCSPKEAYNRAFNAVTEVLGMRGEMCAGSRSVYSANVFVYPDVAVTSYARAIFGAQRYTSYVGQSSPQYHSTITEARRANNAAIKVAEELARKGNPPVTIDARVTPVDKIRFGMGTVSLADTIPSGTKASGDSIRAPDDQSAYAAEWEELMSTYNPKEESGARAKQILKEMLARGYTPKTVAMAQAESYE